MTRFEVDCKTNNDHIILDVVQDKWNRVQQEVREIEIEGDRRRFSMIVINVLDCEHYNAALADFITTIAETMVEDLRPAQPNRSNKPRGRFIRFEEGILCQVKGLFSLVDFSIIITKYGIICCSFFQSHSMFICI